MSPVTDATATKRLSERLKQKYLQLSKLPLQHASKEVGAIATAFDKGLEQLSFDELSQLKKLTGSIDPDLTIVLDSYIQAKRNIGWNAHESESDPVRAIHPSLSMTDGKLHLDLLSGRKIEIPSDGADTSLEGKIHSALKAVAQAKGFTAYEPSIQDLIAYLQMKEFEPSLTALRQRITARGDSVHLVCTALETVSAQLVKSLRFDRNFSFIMIPIALTAGEPLIDQVKQQLMTITGDTYQGLTADFQPTTENLGLHTPLEKLLEICQKLDFREPLLVLSNIGASTEAAKELVQLLQNPVGPTTQVILVGGNDTWSADTALTLASSLQARFSKMEPAGVEGF